jgi:hypothetical protein
MAAASVVLGVVSLLMMFGGIFLTVVPGLGMVLSFGAPVVALVGAVLGGLAMSRAKQEGESSGAAIAGLILSIIAFLFGLVFALTCGLCNALCTASMVTQPRFRDDAGVWHIGDPNAPRPFGPGFFGDAGDVVDPSEPGLPSVDPAPGPGEPPDALPDTSGSGTAPPDEPAISRRPPGPERPSGAGELPPPPLPAGPARGPAARPPSDLPAES